MSLQALLGIELPLLQAPMAGVQGSRLAIAVSNAGGLGALPCATLSLHAMGEEIAAIRAHSPHPFNLNFFCHTPPQPDPVREAAWRELLSEDYRELGIDAGAVPIGPQRRPFDMQIADYLEQWRPPVVSFHFGLPSPELMARLRDWRCRILASATTVDEARWLEAHGVDAVIAQGLEAGGHRGMFLTEDLTTQTGTFALLPQVVAGVGVPVIAAGGIASAKGVAAAMALGAAGVQIGTAYLLSPEADTSEVHRAALQVASATHTALTNVFTGRPARGIVNKAMHRWGPISDRVPAFPLAAAASTPLRRVAEAQGSGDYSPLWAGQNTSGCKPMSAAQLTLELAVGFDSGASPCIV